MMKIGLAADHGGFELKEILVTFLREAGYEVFDFGAETLNRDDDYPDYVLPLARAVSSKEVDRGVAVCGSGVGASIAANKVPGVRAALITDYYSAHQGVEHDDMNILCLGGWVTGLALARDLVKAFLEARYQNEERHQRRLDKIAKLEKLEEQQW
jgi:RpiB/LacA/LacB family sugar-phosphate isomerase